jgi:NTP pyrophosphatase (non-canonical NTP hydrolase)
MVYFNRTGQEYFTPPESGVDFDSRRAIEGSPHLTAGLYYRQHVFPQLAELITDGLGSESDMSAVSLDADQSWNETGWKQPQTTYEAAIRFTGKLQEEVGELDDALEEYWDSRNAAHFIEELGDCKWLFTAIASNSGVVVNDALKARLYEYIAGTRELKDDGTFDYPDWYDAAAELSIKKEPLTIGDIDKLLESGFVPRFSPAMNLYEPEELSPTHTIFELRSYSVFLRGLSERLFEQDILAYQGVALSVVNEQIAKMIAESYLKIAAMARYAGSSMSEVCRINTQKISRRMAENQVDKSDSPR